VSEDKQRDPVDEALGRISAWAWRRHGEETVHSNEAPNPLDRLKYEGKADAFKEVDKYILIVREARDG